MPGCLTRVLCSTSSEPAKDKASKTFDKLKGAALGAGVAIGAALMTGAQQLIGQGDIAGTLQAQLGLGQDEAARAGQIAGKVYADGWGEDLPGVGEAIRAATQNGLVDLKHMTDSTVEQVTSKLMTVGQILGEESDAVSRAVSQMLRTGMAKSADEAMDLLVKATQNGVNKSQDLLDTMNEYGTQFRKLGLDGPRALGLISQAIKAGARDSDVAADALKEFSIRAIDGSKTTADGFKMLGLSSTKMAADIGEGGTRASKALGLTLDKLRGIKDPVKQNAAATALFGTQAEDLGRALFAMNLGTASKQMTGLKGATDKAGQALSDTASSKLETFKRQVQSALVSKLAEAIPYIMGTFGWFQRNSGWVTPVATTLGVLVTAVYAITQAMKAWAVVQGILNLALWTSPITWIVLGIVALIAVIVLIAVKTTWFQTAWKAVWGAIKAYYDVVIGAILTAARTWWSVFSGLWTGVGRGIRAVWTVVWTDAKWKWSMITGAASAALGWFKALPGRMGRAVAGTWIGLWTGFKWALNKIIGAWNSLDFTIGGGSFMGMSFPSMHLGTPKIPYLAKGGIVARSGAAIVGEAGPELVSMRRGAQVTPLSGGAGGGPVVLELRSSGTPLDDLLLEILRRAIRVRGGNVQIVLGR